MFTPKLASFQSSEKVAFAMQGLNMLPDFGGDGMLSGNLVETVSGWSDIGDLRCGDAVATFDGGYAPVKRIERRHVWPAAPAGLIHVPGGALDNCSDVELLPGQDVLIALPWVEDRFDCAGVFVAASALVGFRGITRQSLTRPIEVLSLRFDDEEIVYVNSGTLIRCAKEQSDLAGSKSGGCGAPGYFTRLDEIAARDTLAEIWGKAMMAA
jgi:hypothetical protein